MTKKFVDPDDVKEFVDPDDYDNTIGRAISENTRGAITAAGDLILGLPGMMMGLGAGARELVSTGDFAKARDTLNEVSDLANPLSPNFHLGQLPGTEKLIPDRETGGYKNIMLPVETVMEAPGKYAGAAAYYLGGSPETIEQAGSAGDLLAAGAAGYGIARGPMRAGRNYTRNKQILEHQKNLDELKLEEDAKARMEQESQQVVEAARTEEASRQAVERARLVQAARNQRQAQLERLNQPYRPIDVTKVRGPEEFNLEAKIQEGVEPNRPISRTKLETPEVEPFPFNFEKHENAVPFELRQEVLNRPEVKEMIDNYRVMAEEMKARGEDTTQLQQSFGEYMARYGVRSPQDATGLRRPLYESGVETQLPIEQTKTPNLKKPIPWSERNPTEFEKADPYWGKIVDMNSGIPFKLSDLKIILKQLENLKDLRLAPQDRRDIFQAIRGIQLHQENINAIKNTKYPSKEKTEALKIFEELVIEDSNKIRALLPQAQPLEPKHPGFKQRGTIDLTPLSPYERYKRSVRKNFGTDFPEETIKGMWRMKQKGDAKPFETRTGETKQQALGGIPGIKQKLKAFIPDLRPLDDIKDEINAEPDIASSELGGKIQQKTTLQLMSGDPHIVARTLGSKHIKTYADHLETYKSAVEKNTYELLDSERAGVRRSFNLLSEKDQVEFWRVTQSIEGDRFATRADFSNDRVYHVYKLFEEADKKALDVHNQDRVAHGMKPIPRRPGHFPAKVMGDWLVRVSDKAGNLLYIYSSDYKWQMKGIITDIKKTFPDLEVSKVEERVPYRYKKKFDITTTKKDGTTTKITTEAKEQGTVHLYRAFNELFSVLEKGDPRSKMLSELVKKYDERQSYFHAGAFQHQKFKKGIGGATGRDQFKSELRNSHEAMKAFSDYVGQSFEYAEVRRVQPTVDRLLDPTEFPNKENAQRYIQEHWDRSRGINSALANVIDGSVMAVAHMFGISGRKVRAGTSAVKSQVMLLMLGYNTPRFLAAQLLQPNQFLLQNLQSVQARLGNAGEAFNPSQLAQAWYKGISQTTIPPKYMEPGFRKAYEWGEENRTLEPRILEDIRTEIERQADNTFSYINGQKAIRMTEHIARTQAFLTYYSLLRDLGIEGVENYRTAADLTRITMVDYRPHAKPLIYQNMGMLGDVMSPLMTFKHNYYSQMLMQAMEATRAMKDGGVSNAHYILPFVQGLIMQQIFAGSLGMVLREDWDTLTQWGRELGIIDPDTRNAWQFLSQSAVKIGSTISNGVSTITGKEIDPKFISNLFSHSLLSASGVDISPTFSPASLIPERSSELLAIPGKIGEIAKAAWGAASKRTESSLLNLADKAAPTGVPKAIAEDMATSDEGMVGDPGHRMMGKVKRGAFGRAARYAGVREIEEAKERGRSFQSKQMEGPIRQRKAVLVERAVDALRNRESFEKYMKEASRYGMSPREFQDSMKDLMQGRGRTEEERQFGKMRSFNQYRKWQEIRKYAND